MKKIAQSIAVVSLLAFSGAVFSSAALAQQPAAPAAPTAPAPSAKPATPAAPGAKSQKPRSAKSLECSKQADSQSLHGKPRKAFMSTCKKS